MKRKVQTRSIETYLGIFFRKETGVHSLPHNVKSAKSFIFKKNTQKQINKNDNILKAKLQNQTVGQINSNNCRVSELNKQYINKV